MTQWWERSPSYNKTRIQMESMLVFCTFKSIGHQTTWMTFETQVWIDRAYNVALKSWIHESLLRKGQDNVSTLFGCSQIIKTKIYFFVAHRYVVIFCCVNFANFVNLEVLRIHGFLLVLSTHNTTKNVFVCKQTLWETFSLIVRIWGTFDFLHLISSAVRFFARNPRDYSIEN